MFNNDYTKEIGVNSGPAKVSRPIAIGILGLALLAGWITVHSLPERAHSGHVAPAAVR